MHVNVVNDWTPPVRALCKFHPTVSDSCLHLAYIWFIPEIFQSCSLSFDMNYFPHCDHSLSEFSVEQINNSLANQEPFILKPWAETKAWFIALKKQSKVCLWVAGCSFGSARRNVYKIGLSSKGVESAPEQMFTRSDTRDLSIQSLDAVLSDLKATITEESKWRYYGDIQPIWHFFDSLAHGCFLSIKLDTAAGQLSLAQRLETEDKSLPAPETQQHGVFTLQPASQAATESEIKLGKIGKVDGPHS